MKKPISPRAHGVLDYATALATVAAPSLFNFPQQAARVCYALASGYTGLSLLTDYPLSARRVVPFPVHGAVEVALACALPILPEVLGFKGDKIGTRWCMGLMAITFVVARLTRWSKGNRAA